MSDVCIPGRLPAAQGRFGLIFAVSLLTSVPAYGDNIDDQLIKEAPKILDYLREHKLSSVGVLRFRVKKGIELPTFSAGPINANMVTRLENLLAVAADDGKETIQLIAEPGQTIAAKNAKLTYLDAKGRAELFKLTYHAIGNAKPATVNAFLFGTVGLSEDYATTTVTISAFTPAQLRPKQIAQFTVPTDRNILADIGENFMITKRNWKRGQDRDKVAIRGWKPNTGVTDGSGPTNDEPGLTNDKPGPQHKPPSPPDLKNYLEFKVFYEGEEQTISLDAKKDKWQIAAPRSGQRVEMAIKNVSDKQIGVVLTVNGMNTILSQEGPMSSLGKYILDPKEEYHIKGFLQKDRTLAPFSVVSTAEAEELMSNANVGMIQLAVFDQDPEKEVKVNLRRVTTPELRKTPHSLKEVQKRSGLKRGDDGVIKPDPNAVEAHWKEVDFPDASLAGIRSIVYLNVHDDKKGSEEQ